MALSTKIRAIDQRLIDDLFEIGGGYVLDFSDRTFAEFFADEIGLNIDSPQYGVEGTSKAKRLRFFLRTCDDSVRVRTLLALGTSAARVGLLGNVVAPSDRQCFPTRRSPRFCRRA